MLDRIERFNGTLNAYITVTADQALAQAHKADKELAYGADRGPLHGIPVAVKDLFATKGIRTTCGSKLFEDWIPDHDADAVTRLYAAGCVLLGKTGLHELAFGTTSINPFFGAIGNPWAADHDPGGSSGGSASAVSAGLAYAALGSETGCSVRQPAHCCGIVGHKPTFGLISTAGVQPLVRTMDHVGPLARSVEDASSMLAILAGHNPDDVYSAKQNEPANFDCRGASIGGLRIGIVRQHFFDGYPDVIEVVDAAIGTLCNLGAEPIELELQGIDDAARASWITFAETVAVHAGNLETHPDKLSEELHERLAECSKFSAAAYADAQHFRRFFIKECEELMSQCDVLLAPAATITAAPISDRPEDYRRHAGKNARISDFTGQPSVAIPCGFTDRGLPVGMMLTGRLFQDRKVLQIGHAIQQATDWYRTPPDFP
jgi:aspartyl-tRNA(Asn)/glutamyl-tRNA(Gln) amidotransferase subunit A